MTAVLHREILSEKSYKEIFSPQTEVFSFSELIKDPVATQEEYSDIEMAYGLGWGYLRTIYGDGYFKAGHGTGFYHYSIIFPEQGKGVLILSNSDNTGKIFESILNYTTANKNMPWAWFEKIPYP